MKIDFGYGRPSECSTTALVMFTTGYDKLSDKRLMELDHASNGTLSGLLESGEFTGAVGERAVLTKPAGYQADRVILAGLGDKKAVKPDSYRCAAGWLSRQRTLTCCPSATFHLGAANDPQVYQAVIEGYLLGSYRLLEYKTKVNDADKNRLNELTFAVDHKRLLKRLEKAVERGRIAAESQINVRRLSAIPANDLSPTAFAREATQIAKKYDPVTCRVLDKAAIKSERMGALLAVAQGSEQPPRFVVMEYSGGRSGQKPVVLIGKGVTFDSGGLSLKPSDKMIEMKGDMTGAAVVLSAIQAAAQLKLPLNLVGLMPLAENMPSGSAIRPSDVIKTRKGITVEIISTDAEGRLLLADALDYANEFDPQAVIDIATLTGAALYILGYSGAPILGNHAGLLDRIRVASEATAERVWELPIWDDFRNSIKSDVADIKNSGGKTAGTSTATAFLENFVGDWPWAHIDIAYVDVEPTGRAYTPKGATGFGLRLLVELLSRWKKL